MILALSIKQGEKALLLLGLGFSQASNGSLDDQGVSL